MRPHLSPGSTFGAILVLLLLCGCAAPVSEALPLCVLDPAAMPVSWRPIDDRHKSSSAAAWTEVETKDAASAAARGLDEMVAYFSQRPQAIAALGSDAVESLLDVSYAGSNTPDLKTRARVDAAAIFLQLASKALSRGPEMQSCGGYHTALQLAIYGHSLLPAGDAREDRLIALANAAFHICGSFIAVMGGDYRRTLSRANASIDEVWDLVMWSIAFTDAQTIPGLDIPQQAKALPPDLWRYLATYKLAPARAYPDGARNENFYNTAYLATHIAYLPTGYGRYAIAIADAPWLYRFLRENFYAVLELGELDLTAEFVDLFRQYGCNERNDLQLRDGTRYLLALYHSAGDQWLAHREPNEPADTGDYNIVHKAWTGLSAVRVRVPEAPVEGSYASVVRRWLKPQS